MEGDFSSMKSKKKLNLNGVLHQQGRVLTDRDWNDNAHLQNYWHNVAGRDIIGKGVAAIPADAPDSFKVLNIETIETNKFRADIHIGRGWADGLLLHLENHDNDESFVKRSLTYLPTSEPVFDPATVALVLEVWQESLNAFQIPEYLIEKALGGIDTTERLQTSFAFRLIHLADGDECRNLGGKLLDDNTTKGKLTVSLEPTVVVAGDCPVDAGGGYTGLEHNLYRIEIAHTTGTPMFKWSSFNGGLVGRGKFDADKITITANNPAIRSSGLNDFYLEAVVYDKFLGHWVVEYGENVSLNGNQLTLNGTVYGSKPPGDPENGEFFFRLWNGIKNIDDFSTTTTLEKGIQLNFDVPNNLHKFRPRDYWTFEVRAGEIENPDILIDNELPHGITYHRVPIAKLEIQRGRYVRILQDCRTIFQPLTNLNDCCTYSVGDGEHSFGEFSSIQAAIDNLPDSGGEICLLAGVHKASVRINDKNNIRIHGCGDDAKIVNDSPHAPPVFTISNSRKITLENLSIESSKSAIYITNSQTRTTLKNIEIANTKITSIETPIIIYDSNRVHIHDNFIQLRVAADDDAFGISVLGDDVIIERNDISVLSRRGLGGIQIQDGSMDIKILENKIKGGQGNGVTLGNIVNLNSPMPAYIYDVLIDGNEIGYMKRAGIGPAPFSTFDPASFPADVDAMTLFTKALGAPVSNLQIKNNFISKCANGESDRRVNDLKLGRAAGISLMIVENLIIQQNIIKENGTSHIDPICGIFYLFGTHVEISQNKIIDNGPLTSDGGKLNSGLRGGVYALFSSSFGFPKFNEKSYEIKFDPRPALSLHDNIIDQPAGPALFTISFGHDSITNNYLHTEIAGEGEEFQTIFSHFWTALLVSKYPQVDQAITSLKLGWEPPGVAFVFNLGAGGIGSLQGDGYNKSPAYATDAALIGGISTDAVPIRVPHSSAFFPDLPNGSINFTNNQILAGHQLNNRWSHHIFSLDDINYSNNYSNCENISNLNALLAGATVRATNNRFREPHQTSNPKQVSLATIGLLSNITTNNQGDHCIHVFGTQSVNAPNHVLNPTSECFTYNPLLTVNIPMTVSLAVEPR